MVCDNLVGIVIPVYKAEKFVKKCIDSLLRQTYPRIEIIVIYDESPDNTLKILEGYKGKINLIKQRKTSPAFARNVGLSHAHGKYIAFCDIDDFFAPDKIEKQVKALNENPNIGLVYTDVIKVDPSGNVIGFFVCPEWNRKKWLCSHFITFSCIMVKREILEIMKDKDGYYFDPKLRAFDDFDFLIRASRITEFKRIPEFLTYYTVSKFSLSRNWHEMNIITSKIEWKHKLFINYVKSVFFIIPMDYLIHKSSILKRLYEIAKKLVIR